MESIDALALAVNEYHGGMVLVSHDMRLISQVAKEIWICDDKTVAPFKGDIQNFKMNMRAQMGIDNADKSGLRGDASVQRKESDTTTTKTKTTRPPEPKLEILAPFKKPVTDDAATTTTATSNASTLDNGNDTAAPAAPAAKRYIPPHLRR